MLKRFFKNKSDPVCTEQGSDLILGVHSCVYKEAKIDNLSSDKGTIVIGSHSHIRGHLLTYPSGGGDYIWRLLLPW